MIERVSDNIDVVINNSTYLFCLATGFPVPSITWLKNGSTINLYSDVSLNMRIDIFEFDIRNESDVSSGFMGSGSIEEFLNSTAIDSSEIMALGDLGVVSFLRFYDVVREDTAMYSCVAVNELQQTARLRNESSSIQLTVLGKYNLAYKRTNLRFESVMYKNCYFDQLLIIHTHTHL